MQHKLVTPYGGDVIERPILNESVVHSQPYHPPQRYPGVCGVAGNISI